MDLITVNELKEYRSKQVLQQIEEIIECIDRELKSKWTVDDSRTQVRIPIPVNSVVMDEVKIRLNAAGWDYSRTCYENGGTVQVITVFEFRLL